MSCACKVQAVQRNVLQVSAGHNVCRAPAAALPTGQLNFVIKSRISRVTDEVLTGVHLL